MTGTHQAIARPAFSGNAPAAAPLARAARTVDRWGLLAGVTGFLANVLLVVLFTTPADRAGRPAESSPRRPSAVA